MPSPSATQLESLKASLAAFGSRTKQRGLDYFRSGRVKDWEWDEIAEDITAAVEGTEIYEVALFQDEDGTWEGECACPVGFDCKHAYALGRAVLEFYEGEADLEKSRKQSKQPTLLQRSKAMAQTALGRGITPQEREALLAVQQIFREFSQYGRTHFSFAHDQRLHALGPLRRHFSEDFFSRLSRFKQCPRTDLKFLQFFIHQAESLYLAVPEAWTMHRDAAYLESTVRPFFLEFEVERWANARRPKPVGTSDQSAPRQPVDLRVDLSLKGAHLSSKNAGSRNWSATTKTWLEWLGKHPSPVHYKQLPPAAHALATVLAGHAQGYYRFDPRGALPEAILGEILAYDPAHPAVFLPDGSTFSIQASPLAHHATVKPRGDAVEFFLVAPDGPLHEPPRLITSSPEPFFLADNKVYRGPPPLPTSELSIEALKTPAVSHQLKTLQITLPESLEAKFETVPLRPFLRCWMDPAFPRDALDGALIIELSAREEAFHQHFVRVADCWEPAPDHRPFPKGAEHPIYRHDITAPRIVAEALRELPAHCWREQKIWRHQPRRNFADTFRAFLEKLPPETHVEVSAPLKGFLDGPVSVDLDFEVTPDDRSDRDWFDLQLVLKPSDTTLTPEEVTLLAKAKGRWVYLPQRGWTRLETSGDPTREATLDALGLNGDDVLANGTSQRHRLHALQLAPHADNLPSGKNAGWKDGLKRRIQELTTAPPSRLPDSLTATLRPYQEEGFQYLEHLDRCHLGGILADDMGLGKTVQSLAWLLAAARRHKETSETAQTPFRALAVCPKSVMHGWASECARFAPGLTPELFQPRVKTMPSEGAKGPHLTIANYAQLRLNAARFCAIPWNAVILDEAQNIKNPRSKVTQAACALNAQHRLALTGTPIENRLLDLWSILQFAQPGLLGPQAQFKRQYPPGEPASIQRLRRRVRHFMLRRTKSQVARDLPARTEDTVLVDLEPKQRKLYDAELKRARQQILKIDTAADFQAARFNVLASLLRLRQIACHPALVDPAYDGHPSTKVNALLEQLVELRAEGHKILVFSQFVTMLQRLADALAAAPLPHLLLTGKTENRQELVERFQTDPAVGVFLLSLKAAGSGLNLTAASYVFLFDPWWNPAVEAQAIDRTHRIGQTQPVIAYRLIAKDTIEEKIRLLQQEKAALAGQIVQEDALDQVLDLESLKKLFT